MQKLIEKIGRGTQRIVEDCRNAKIKEPKWESSSLETSLTFFSASRMISTSLDSLSDRQQKIIEVLKPRGSLKAANIAAAIGGGVTDRTIRNDLLALVEGGWVIKRGRGPSTSYALKEKETKP